MNACGSKQNNAPMIDHTKPQQNNYLSNVPNDNPIQDQNEKTTEIAEPVESKSNEFSLLLTREEVKNELEKVIDDWGEAAFVVDDELVRHVAYFYKYYAIKEFEKSNRAIKRSQKYLPDIIDIFSKYKIPEDVAFALPFVESQFVASARSNVGAVGMFQFMRDTARLYGLSVCSKNDERENYQKAAEACAKYLRNNRNVFASTLLSLGSYHHGTGKVSQVLLTAAYEDERNFEAIFNNQRLGSYSKEYIPQCLSAVLIYRLMKEKNLSLLPEVTFEAKTLKEEISVKTIEKTVADLYSLNPDLQNVDTTYDYANTDGYLLLSQLSIGKISIDTERPTSPIKEKVQEPIFIPKKIQKAIPVKKNIKRQSVSVSPKPKNTEQEIPVVKEKKSKSKKSKSKPLVYQWPKNPALKPLPKHFIGQAKYIRYIFQENNDLNVIADIFGTTVAEIKRSHENRYLLRRSPRAGDIIRIDGLSPLTQKIGGHGYLCTKQMDFKTESNETLKQVCRRAVSVIKNVCTKRQVGVAGTYLTPELIYYWNSDLLGTIGPNDKLKPGIPLTIYSDYLWIKPQKKTPPNSNHS